MEFMKGNFVVQLPEYLPEVKVNNEGKLCGAAPRTSSEVYREFLGKLCGAAPRTSSEVFKEFIGTLCGAVPRTSSISLQGVHDVKLYGAASKTSPRSLL